MTPVSPLGKVTEVTLSTAPTRERPGTTLTTAANEWVKPHRAVQTVPWPVCPREQMNTHTDTNTYIP